MCASRGTWCSCFAGGFACYSWWLPSPRRLGAARIIEWRVVIVRGSWPFLGGEPKGTLVDCSWLVWSSSCVGCAAPYWGFGVWCQLAREPSSEWIATTRSSLPVSKWTSVKNHCIYYLILRWLVFIVIHSYDWLAPSLTRQPSCSLSLHYRKLVVKLFSVASCESLLVWLVWLLISFWEHTNLV